MKTNLQKIPVWVLLILCGLLAWGWTLTFDFVWDDFAMIVTNPSLTSWKTLFIGWKHDFWMLHESPQVSGYWRPIPTMFHVLIFHLSSKPWIFHLLSIALHILTAWFFYVYVCHIDLIRRKWIPALIFLLHPINAETVSFLSAAPDLLSACFGWAAIAIWSRSQNSSSKTILQTLGLLACSFLSKESGVFFGLFLIASDFFLRRPFFKNERSWPMYLGTLGLMVLYGTFHVLITGGNVIHQPWGSGLASYIGTICKLFGYQFFLLFIPIQSSPTREFSIPTSFADPGFLAGAILFCGFVISFFYFWRKKSPWAFLILFYLIFWFPVSNILPIEGLIADRYLYVLSMAMALAMGMASNYFKKIHVLFGIFFVVWGTIAFSHTLPWKNSKTLWAHAISVSPGSSVAWNEWGNIQISENHIEEAKASYEKSISLQPAYQDASFNLSFSYFLLKNYRDCFESLKTHLGRFPDDDRAFDLMAALYELGGDYDQAIQMTKRAIDLAPYQWKYHYNLAETYVKIQNYGTAIEELQVALALAPGRFEVWKNLAATYCQNANYAECLRTYQQLINRFPQKQPEVEPYIKQAQQLMELTEGH